MHIKSSYFALSLLIAPVGLETKCSVLKRVSQRYNRGLALTR